MKCIVVGTDFSAPSRVAVRQAAVLTHRLGARLLLVHAGAVPDSATLQATEAMKVFSERLLDEQEGRLLSQVPDDVDISVEAVAVPGHPIDTLCEVAKKERADLVVVGTHGRTGVSRVVLGSVAEGVIRRCACPVLAARSERDFRRILVPTDFSIVAELALDFALAIAASNAEVELLHAWDPPDALLDATEADAHEYRSLMRGQLEESIAPIIDSRKDGPAALQFVTTPRAAIRGILERAEKHPYDCIVMGTQGQSGVRALIAGSVALSVVRHAACSVIVVPPPWRGRTEHG